MEVRLWTFGPFLVTLPAIYICNCKFSYFTGLWNCVLTILHDFQPLYVWGVSAYLSMLIKMLTLGLCVWFPFTIPNPVINLGYYVRPPVAGPGALHKQQRHATLYFSKSTCNMGTPYQGPQTAGNRVEVAHQ